MVGANFTIAMRVQRFVRIQERPNYEFLAATVDWVVRDYFEQEGCNFLASEWEEKVNRELEWSAAESCPPASSVRKVIQGEVFAEIG